eukprot:TRINITY_DN3517_c0_g3_i1.p1 TRINITY_DN3517_c0_g3~~TRINITY_DN3517_c0_g3_i1.p1  ORF type:complete len:177 (-),score=1.75 TRINITY_DN3517_c0_g3_i1:371-901(-)
MLTIAFGIIPLISFCAITVTLVPLSPSGRITYPEIICTISSIDNQSNASFHSSLINTNLTFPTSSLFHSHPHFFQNAPFHPFHPFTLPQPSPLLSSRSYSPHRPPPPRSTLSPTSISLHPSTITRSFNRGTDHMLKTAKTYRFRAHNPVCFINEFIWPLPEQNDVLIFSMASSSVL